MDLEPPQVRGVPLSKFFNAGFIKRIGWTIGDRFRKEDRDNLIALLLAIITIVGSVILFNVLFIWQN